MKKQRVLALLLCLALLCTLIPGVSANDNASSTGMEISKTATANDDGTYTVTLEAYATGSKIISEVKKDIPTDIVLVLDQSGSMANDIGSVSFEAYKDESGFFGTTYHTLNQDYYEVRANGNNPNLYYPLGDGSYASVSVTVSNPSATYTEISGWNNYYYNYYQDNVYAFVNGKYQRVIIEPSSSNWETTYIYKLSDGTTIATGRGWDNSPNFNNNIGVTKLYQLSADQSQNVYTYTYTDADGVLQTIGSSTGATTRPPFTLYKKVTSTSGGGSRLNALKKAVTTFANSVAQKAAGEDGTLGTKDDVNHRIAMVGFASSGTQYNRNQYENTEVFVGETQYTYGASATSQYGNAMQDMNTETGKKNIEDSISVLDAYGGTFTDLGMEMANGVLNANPVKEGEERNRVIIVFTDGMPGTGNYSSTVGDAAIKQGDIAKKDGVTIYTVGIFSGADATNAGSESGNDTAKANWFMQNLSSNNGEVQTPSYYLSAADADTLSNIFQQISDQIESGGSSSTLSSETVIKDIISDSFTLPAGATADDITLETYHCTGKSGEKFTFSDTPNETAMGAKATVNSDQVSVTGFNFADNYVGTVTENGEVTYRGDKLVISFTVSPKDGFLGGNNVYTNASAGVYENSSAAEPVLTFEQPQVNVPIKDVTVTAADENVYLLGSVTGAQLKDGATVKVGDVALDLSADNYGLETWQTEYVDITVAIKDKDGNSVTDKLSGLTDDTTYSISVTVAPKKPANDTSSGTAAVEKSNSDSGNVNVFKPEFTVTAQDIWADYHEGVNLAQWGVAPAVTVEWKHGDTLDTAVTMLGDTTDGEGNTVKARPTIADYTYTFAKQSGDGTLTDGVYTTGEADANFNITGMTCTVGGSSYTVPSSALTVTKAVADEDHDFTIHINHFALTLEKKINGVDLYNQSFIFTVTNNTKHESFQVSLAARETKTIVGMVCGMEYQVDEEESWSWRYSDSQKSYTKSNEISNTKPAQDTVEAALQETIINTLKSGFDKWLSDCSEIKSNVFNKKTKSE